MDNFDMEFGLAVFKNYTDLLLGLQVYTLLNFNCGSYTYFLWIDHNLDVESTVTFHRKFVYSIYNEKHVQIVEFRCGRSTSLRLVGLYQSFEVAHLRIPHTTVSAVSLRPIEIPHLEI